MKYKIKQIISVNEFCLDLRKSRTCFTGLKVKGDTVRNREKRTDSRCISELESIRCNDGFSITVREPC